MPGRTRVLVIEDSETVRRHLVAVLSADPGLEVVGSAADGRTGIELCEALRPDVITLDMMLPVLDGVTATEHIMAYCPTPILIVSSSTNRGELFRTYDALAAGAVDVLEKPHGDETDDSWERRLIATVKLIARIKVITHPRARLGAGRRVTAPAPRVNGRVDGELRAIAIGVSTGGPGALRHVFRHLPGDFPVPILLVIHIGEMFAHSLAEWLDAQCALAVRWAVDGERLAAVRRGQVVMAPAGRHLVLRDGGLQLTDDPERHSCRPSVDVLFESLARELGAAGAGCLLTGMGRDGAQGLLEIRRAGGPTIAQDEASSVVFGMPREASLLGAADRILSLDAIGPALVELARREGPR